jgi:acyl-CoA dehydrogenase
MEFKIPTQLKMIQQMVRRFVEEELVPRENLLPPLSGDLDPSVFADLVKKMRQLGIWNLSVPKEYGGVGLSWIGQALINTELNKSLLGTVGVGLTMMGEPPIVLYDASEDQKKRYLYPMIAGEKRYCFAQTEPNAGSDPSMMETTAVLKGDRWIINGRKIFISGADVADFAIVVTLTDREKKARGGITTFLVDKGTPGFIIARQIETMGGHRPSELVFDNCEVPPENVLGEVGVGFGFAQKWIVQGRLLNHPPAAIGAAERCLKMAIDYVKERVTFGKPLADRQAIQWMIADSAAEIHWNKLLMLHACYKADLNKDVRHEAAMCKVYASEMGCRVVDRVIQMHGGYGYTRELPFERYYRDLRRSRITEGASEVQRFIMARSLLRGYSPLDLLAD